MISKILLEWFYCHKRNLPWRHSYNPYEVWISEIMLQQTQIDRVIPFFNHWMERFPNLAELTEASEEEILKLWEGLGYYSRARNILKAAKQLVHMGYSTVPPDEAVLRKLPGIGAYTAGAILSIAYNLPFPAVDGNVRRVFARLFNIDMPVISGMGLDLLNNYVLSTLPSENARDFNQSVMELGALVCIPRSPRCPLCPLQKFCQAFQEGEQNNRPITNKKAGIQKKKAVAGIFYCDKFILLRQRETDGSWGGLWEFPWGFEHDDLAAEEVLMKEIDKVLGTASFTLRSLGRVRHSFMYTQIDLNGYVASLPSLVHVETPFKWVMPKELSKLPLQGGSAKLLHLFIKKSRPSSIKGLPHEDI